MQCSISGRKTYNQISPVWPRSPGMFFELSAWQVADTFLTPVTGFHFVDLSRVSTSWICGTELDKGTNICKSVEKKAHVLSYLVSYLLKDRIQYLNYIIY